MNALDRLFKNDVLLTKNPKKYMYNKLLGGRVRGCQKNKPHNSSLGNVLKIFRQNSCSYYIFFSITAGRVRLASSLAFCLKLEGTVEEGNPEHPGKLRQSYYNPLKDQYLQFNFWVLYTDYDNLTVVYACEKTLGDGTCDPGSTFIWTLSRGTSQSPAEKTKVQELSSAVCLDVASLRQMNHTTECPMT